MTTLEITPELKVSESDINTFRSMSIYLSPLVKIPYFCDENGTNPNHISCETYRKFQENKNIPLLLSWASVTEDTPNTIAENFQEVIGMKQDIKITLNGKTENEAHIGTLVQYSPKQENTSFVATWFWSGLLFSWAIEEKGKIVDGVMGDYFLQNWTDTESWILSEGVMIPGKYTENSFSLSADYGFSERFPETVVLHMEDVTKTSMDISLRWLLPYGRKTEKVVIVKKDGEKKEMPLIPWIPNTADFVKCENIHGKPGKSQVSEECILHFDKQTQSDIYTIIIENILQMIDE